MTVVAADAVKGPREGVFYRAFHLSARRHSRCFLSDLETSELFELWIKTYTFSAWRIRAVTSSKVPTPFTGATKPLAW